MSRIISRSKRVAAIILALAMVFALSANAFAAEQTNTVTAYLKLQSASVPEGSWDYNIGSLVDPENITNGFVQVRVTKAGDITVKDIVNQFLADTGYGVVTCPACGTYGCDPALCECEDCECTWKKVANMVYDPATGSYVADGTYASVLNSIALGDDVYTNYAEYTYNNDGTTTYEGTSWEYFVTNCNNNQTEYPQSLYMDQYVINYSAYITLSFDTSSFTF